MGYMKLESTAAGYSMILTCNRECMKEMNLDEYCIVCKRYTRFPIKEIKGMTSSTHASRKVRRVKF